MSAIKMDEIAEPFIRRRAVRHLEKGRVVIFSSGTGNPYFTTDTTAALRSVEVGAQAVLKATKVDGVYSEDPHKNSNAKRYTYLTFKDVINKELKVMDLTAITLCKENNLPIIVFDVSKKDALFNIFNNKNEGTLISKGDIKC